MKRKADSNAAAHKSSNKKSKTSLTSKDAQSRFRKGLFDKKVLDGYTKGYAESSPYKHSVINGLVDDKLLRAVREEIKENVSFTPKETDIYKIHQSGDLANLDGLENDALAKLPSLLALRDALYSQDFRDYVSHITGCGPLSGKKTDMAINVYTPGCYLLCHDDVIGSRKVSYILYLVDPDIPWKAEWGGALRLFPVRSIKGKDGQTAKTPEPFVTKVIPPAWNQLSFFAVQPGESFHDVEEVYHAESKEQLEKQGGRVRMAISGWFHIPQIGEDGYVQGAEEKLAKNSGLMQLQGNPDQYDAPCAAPVVVKDPQPSSPEDFDEADLEFLLKYMAPTYLTPDTLEQILEHFDEASSITLPDLLNKKFGARLREYIAKLDSAPLPENSNEIEKSSSWKVAKPPHKHRYVYKQPSGGTKGKNSKADSREKDSPLQELLDVFLPSPQFRRWLQMATSSVIESHDLVARRFRRGQDYTLATGHDGKPRLELNLGLTPTPGWGDVDEEDEDEDEEGEEEEEVGKKASGKSKSKSKSKSNGKAKAKAKAKEPEEPVEVGGHEVYMAGDDDADEDAAIYKSSGDDDNILFFQAAAWNKLTIVLRDSGALKFVKYVSQRAPGDRWDVSATFEIEEQDEDGDEEEEEEEEKDPLADDTEEEWNGFSDKDQEDSDSD
ncbi:Oxoglutarate and iron-dependent oxygenase degradation C-term-domain-containing protein [Xylariales sp. PMI_506]|nr:Oxoglutarate and iron-dependent oxygenase degradation C-term-domain-containing protein [Xylariales sp. PMI_506]